MFKFLKKLFGIGQDPTVEIEMPVVEPVTESEKVIVVEKKTPRSKLPKKEKAVKTTKKMEKPALKVVKADAAPVKKRGRPAKKK